jgi:dTDP-glucose 4,6-dehydratase/UDP-glucose 4-epimerase
MNILVIGSNGFIGSHCVNHLSQNGFRIYQADVFSNNDINSNFFLIDKVNPEFNNIFKTINFEICINATGSASVPNSFENPNTDFTLNTLNVLKILDAIRLYAPNCFFINFSSAAIYGNPQNLPIKEFYPASPLSPYGWHKYYAEQICEEYFNYFKIKSCNLRIFSAYGPNLRKQFFWDLYCKIKSFNNIELFGSGEETRDFIFIDDLTRCIELIILNRFDIPRYINIASGIETKIIDAAKVFVKLFGTNKAVLFNGNTRSGEPLNWRADITVLEKIGFVPQFDIEKGLEKYIKWLRLERE